MKKRDKLYMKSKNKQKHKRTQREFAPEVVETKDFSALIVKDKDGKNKLQIKAPVWYQHQINKFKVGETVSVYVSSRRPKRTVQQNRYYWFYLGEIAKETGEMNTDRLHRLFTGKFLTEEIVEVLGEKVRMVKSTTTLSKYEFSEYIEKIAGETGIEAPPTENYFDK